MNIKIATYKDYSQCEPNFINGMEFLARGLLGQAAHCFEMAYEKISYNDLHFTKYASFCGYLRVLSAGDRGGLSLCREVAAKELYDGDVFYNLAKSEWYFKNRKNTHIALYKGLKVDSTHPGLKELSAMIGVRKYKPIGFLPRRHMLNNALGKLMRK